MHRNHTRNFVLIRRVASACLIAAAVSQPAVVESSAQGGEKSGASPEAAKSEANRLTFDKPKRFPKLRKLLDDAAYEQQSAAALKELGDLAKLAKGVPLGFLVAAVKPGEQAERLKLKAGDAIVKVNENRVWALGDLEGQNPREPRKLSVVTAGGKERTIRVAPGLIGVEGNFAWRPEVIFLQGEHRDPRWDTAMVVGLAERSRNPRLAETALARAVETGYPADALVAGAAMLTALEDARPADAVAFAWYAAQGVEADTPVTSPRDLFRALVANAKFPAAAQLVETCPSAFRNNAPEWLVQMAGLYNTMSEVEREEPTPSEIAAQRMRNSLLNRLRLVKAGNEPMGDFLTRPLPQTISFPTGQFQHLIFEAMDPAHDVEAKIRFTLRPTSDDPSPYSKTLEFSLVEGRSEDSQWIELIGEHSQKFYHAFNQATATQLAMQAQPKFLNFMHGGEENFGVSLAYEEPGIFADGQGENELRIVCVGRWVEGFVNGRRVLLAPLARVPAQLRLVLKVVGTTVEFRQIVFDELIERL